MNKQVKNTTVKASHLALIPALMIPFLTYKNFFFFFQSFLKRKPKHWTPQLHPQKVMQHIQFSNSTQHYICKAAIPCGCNILHAAASERTWAKQSSEGTALLLLSLKQATGILRQLNSGLQAPCFSYSHHAKQLQALRAHIPPHCSHELQSCVSTLHKAPKPIQSPTQPRPLGSLLPHLLSRFLVPSKVAAGLSCPTGQALGSDHRLGFSTKWVQQLLQLSFKPKHPT